MEWLVKIQTSVGRVVDRKEFSWLLYSRSGTSLTMDENIPILRNHLYPQWNLVCEWESYQPWFQASLSFGNLVGSVVGGEISDRYDKHEE